jgi:hypothetical protein
MEFRNCKNVFEYLSQGIIYQRLHDFKPPRGIDSFSITRIGSVERIEAYRKRLELGYELFASTDVDEALAIEKSIADQKQFDADMDQSFFPNRKGRRIR